MNYAHINIQSYNTSIQMMSGRLAEFKKRKQEKD